MNRLFLLTSAVKVNEKRLLRAVFTLSAGHAEQVRLRVSGHSKDSAGWKSASHPSPAASVSFVFHHILQKYVLLKKKEVGSFLTVKKPQPFSLKQKARNRELEDFSYRRGFVKAPFSFERGERGNRAAN